MVIITDIVNLTDLVTKATDLLLCLPDKWYKGTLEIESFKSNLSILRQRTTQWKRQLNQFGMSEDPAVKTLLDHAAKLLDKEDDYYQKHRKSRLWKVNRRLFPGKLTYILAEVLKVVEAGPGLLAEGVKTHELLTKSLPTIPSPLPFGYDRKYVPLPGAVAEVQKALDDPEGPRVVTLYGEPGIGKSSLAKYVSLLYQDSICGSGSSSFDGVQYLFCGQESRKRMHQLQKKFLSDRGVALPVTEPAAIEGQERDHQMFRSTLGRLLDNQKLLIILDDVWKEDFDVLVNLICPGNGMKFLVTSQTRRIWPDALNIEVSKPDDEQALQILINHTEGLSAHRQTQSLCKNLKTGLRDIAEKVEHHPLSLVNVAVSMNRHGATDPNRWKVLAQNLYNHLDQNRYTDRILVNERPYSLSVSTSMMLMVESLRATERDLLFLVAMLQASYGIPEALIKYFFRRLYHTDAAELSYNYASGVDYLEDNSLVQFQRDGSGLTLGDSVEIKRACIKIHNLRREYIRQKRSPELQSIARTILATQGEQDRSLVYVNVRDSDQCLATVLSTVYFDDFLIDEVALPFQRVMAHMNGGMIPRGLTQQIDAHELVRSTKAGQRRFAGMLCVAVELLNLQGDEGWKRKARTDTTKVMMKLVCREEFEDDSMASLLRMPQTTAAACQIFDFVYEYIYHRKLQNLFYFGQKRRSLSDTHPQTWTALSDLVYKNSWYETFWHLESSQLPSRILNCMLEFEPERTVLAEVKKLQQFADQSPNPLLRTTVEDGFVRLHESRLTSQMLSGPGLEYLPIILWKLINDDKLLVSSKLQRVYERAVECVYNDKGYVQILFTFLISCDKWLRDSSLFRRLLRIDQGCSTIGGWGLLGLLSGILDFAAKVDILKVDCWEKDFTRWPESYDGRLVLFWGNVALVRDVHETTRRGLVKIAQRWIAKLKKNGTSACFCACSCLDDGCSCSPKCWERFRFPQLCGHDGAGVLKILRTVTIINHFHANFTITIPVLEDSRQNALACMGQAQAYQEMGMYAEAILCLDSAQQTFDPLPGPSGNNTLEELRRLHMIFVRAMAKDYAGSMGLLKEYLDEHLNGKYPQSMNTLQLGNRAVLSRLVGNFPGAILDFDRFLKMWERISSTDGYIFADPRVHNFIKYCLLRHRGYAKHLMGDHEGSRRDAKSAQELKANNLIVEPVSWEYCWYPWFPLGLYPHIESPWQYSLLQLPINDHDFLS